MQRHYEVPCDTSTAVFSPDGTSLLIGTYAGEIEIKHAQNGETMQKISGHGTTIKRLLFSQDGNVLLSASHNGLISGWATKDWQLLFVLKANINTISDLIFIQADTTFVSGSADGTIKFWKTENGQHDILFDKICDPSSPKMSSFFLPMRTVIHESGEKRWIVDLAAANAFSIGHKGRVSRLALAPDGSCFASCSDQAGTLKIWDLQKRTCVRTWQVGQGVFTLFYFVDQVGMALFLAGWRRLSLCSDLPKEIANLVAHYWERYLLLSLHRKGALKIWDPAAESCRGTLTCDVYFLIAAAFFPQERRLVLGDLDGTVKQWCPRSTYLI